MAHWINSISFVRFDVNVVDVSESIGRGDGVREEMARVKKRREIGICNKLPETFY